MNDLEDSKTLQGVVLPSGTSKPSFHFTLHFAFTARTSRSVAHSWTRDVVAMWPELTPHLLNSYFKARSPVLLPETPTVIGKLLPLRHALHPPLKN